MEAKKRNEEKPALQVINKLQQNEDALNALMLHKEQKKKTTWWASEKKIQHRNEKHSG